MAQVGFSAITVPVVNGTQSQAYDAASFERKTVTIEGTFTATYQVQISLDPSASPASTSWANYGTALTAAGVVEVTAPCAWVRVACTAYTSGTPTGHYAGYLQYAR